MWKGLFATVGLLAGLVGTQVVAQVVAQQRMLCAGPVGNGDSPSQILDPLFMNVYLPSSQGEGVFWVSEEKQVFCYDEVGDQSSSGKTRSSTIQIDIQDLPPKFQKAGIDMGIEMNGETYWLSDGNRTIQSFLPVYSTRESGKNGKKISFRIKMRRTKAGYTGNELDSIILFRLSDREKEYSSIVEYNLSQLSNLVPTSCVVEFTNTSHAQANFGRLSMSQILQASVGEQLPLTAMTRLHLKKSCASHPMPHISGVFLPQERKNDSSIMLKTGNDDTGLSAKIKVGNEGQWVNFTGGAVKLLDFDTTQNEEEKSIDLVVGLWRDKEKVLPGEFSGQVTLQLVYQ